MIQPDEIEFFFPTLMTMFSDRTNWNLTANRLSEALAQHRAAGKLLLDLSASNPTECGFAHDPSILSALANPRALTYSPDPRGLEFARRAVAAYYASRGVNVSPGDIFLTTSTSEAYSFAFRLLCNPGDEILIPAPSYPLFDYLAELHDVKLFRYPLLYDHSWQLDFRELEWALTERTRALIVVNPNNPTGHFCKPAEIARLNDICAQRSLALIADEVFLDFALAPAAGAGASFGSGTAHASSFAANAVALTFTFSGISKICGLPQMKAAWLAISGPSDLKRDAIARLDVIADTFLSMNAPVQLALPSFLELRADFQLRVMLAPPRQSSRARPPASRAAILLAPGMRGRLVRRPARPGHATRRAASDRVARVARRVRPSRPFLRFPPRRILGGEPADARARIRRGNFARPLVFCRRVVLFSTAFLWRLETIPVVCFVGVTGISNRLCVAIRFSVFAAGGWSCGLGAGGSRLEVEGAD